MHYANTTFDFLEDSLIEKGNILLLNHHIFMSNKNEVLLIYCNFSFSGRRDIKEIGCSFEVPLFPYCFKFKF